MNDRAKIKEKPTLIKDLNNFAILNTDKAVVAQHRLKMAELERKKKMETEINNLKSEVSEIKNMLGDVLKAVSREK